MSGTPKLKYEGNKNVVNSKAYPGNPKTYFQPINVQGSGQKVPSGLPGCHE